MDSGHQVRKSSGSINYRMRRKLPETGVFRIEKCTLGIVTAGSAIGDGCDMINAAFRLWEGVLTWRMQLECDSSGLADANCNFAITYCTIEFACISAVCVMPWNYDTRTGSVLNISQLSIRNFSVIIIKIMYHSWME